MKQDPCETPNGTESWVNARVTVTIPLDDVSIDDDPHAKIEAATIRVDRSEAVDAIAPDETMTVGWEDMVNGEPRVIQRVEPTENGAKVDTGDGWVLWNAAQVYDFAQQLIAAVELGPHLRTVIEECHQYGLVEGAAELAYKEAGDHPRRMQAALEAGIEEALSQFDSGKAA